MSGAYAGLLFRSELGEAAFKLFALLVIMLFYFVVFVAAFYIVDRWIRPRWKHNRHSPDGEPKVSRPAATLESPQV